MPSSRSLAQFARAKWRLMILLPFWFIQLTLNMGMVGLFAWRLGDTIKTYKEQDDLGNLPKIEVAWESANVGFAFIAAVATFFEIARYAAEALTPWTMLFTHVIKMSCASAILALDIVIYVQRHDRHYSLIGLALDGAFIITACILVIYSVHTYRRLSVYDEYAHPVNVKPFGFNDRMEQETSYQGRISVRNSIEQRISSVSSRTSVGSASIKSDPTSAQHPLERTPSHYTHQRDTQFDEYRAQRGSVGSRGDLEKAMSGEFGWSGAPTHLQEELARRESVNTGMVKSRPRGLSSGRIASYNSDHALVAVPEEEDGDEHQDKTEQATAHEALLGNDRRDSKEGAKVLRHEVDSAEPPRWRRER